MKNYMRMSDVKEHIVLCITTWSHVPKQEWTYGFIHRLETVPKNSYVELEMHIGTTN
jgi:hypothetical protein